VIFFDKDRAANCWFVRRAAPTCVAPWRAKRSHRYAVWRTPRRPGFSAGVGDRADRGRRQGGIASEEARRLERGIARQLSYEPEMRSLAGLREFLLHGPAEGAGARLERWCRGNALGWAFDGDATTCGSTRRSPASI